MKKIFTLTLLALITLNNFASAEGCYTAYDKRLKEAIHYVNKYDANPPKAHFEPLWFVGGTLLAIAGGFAATNMLWLKWPTDNSSDAGNYGPLLLAAGGVFATIGGGAIMISSLSVTDYDERYPAEKGIIKEITKVQSVAKFTGINDEAWSTAHGKFLLQTYVKEIPKEYGATEEDIIAIFNNGYQSGDFCAGNSILTIDGIFGVISKKLSDDYWGNIPVDQRNN